MPENYRSAVGAKRPQKMEQKGRYGKEETPA